MPLLQILRRAAAGWILSCCCYKCCAALQLVGFFLVAATNIAPRCGYLDCFLLLLQIFRRAAADWILFMCCYKCFAALRLFGFFLVAATNVAPRCLCGAMLLIKPHSGEIFVVAVARFEHTTILKVRSTVILIFCHLKYCDTSQLIFSKFTRFHTFLFHSYHKQIPTFGIFL